MTTNTPVTVINEIGVSDGDEGKGAAAAGSELLQAAALASLLGRKRVVVVPIVLG